MAITFVSQTTVNATGDLAVTLPTHASGDIIWVYAGWECNADIGTAVSESVNGGFTKIFDEEHLSDRDRRVSGWWLRAASASETNPTFTLDSVSGQEGACTVIVLRGCVAAGSPLDVTYSAGSHASDTIDTINVSNPAITTNTDAAWVLLNYYGTHNEITGAGAPTGYTLRSSVVANNENSAIATKEVTTAGTETPGAWTHTGTPVETDVSAVTIAIKPAAAAGGAKGQLAGGGSPLLAGLAGGSGKLAA